MVKNDSKEIRRDNFCHTDYQCGQANGAYGVCYTFNTLTAFQFQSPTSPCLSCQILYLHLEQTDYLKIP
jgi:hypothetical protein